jgi:hypothetical protein
MEGSKGLRRNGAKLVGNERTSELLHSFVPSPCCSDCYRTERASFRADFHRLWLSAFARRTEKSRLCYLPLTKSLENGGPRSSGVVGQRLPTGSQSRVCCFRKRKTPWVASLPGQTFSKRGSAQTDKATAILRTIQYKRRAKLGNS